MKFQLPRNQQLQNINIALDATIRAAAARGGFAAKSSSITISDIREKILKHPSPLVIAFIVDNSWSVHVLKTLEQTKGMILGFLKDASHHGDKVALIAFRHSRNPGAVVALPPSKSYLQAEKCLRGIPLSGSTPLPDAFWKGYKLLVREKQKNNNAIPLLVSISDGIPTFPLKAGGDPYQELYKICGLIRRQQIQVSIIDTLTEGKDAEKSCNRRLAALTGGRYLSWKELTAHS
ncbi:MAG: VWA domain-containing protein [Firmicutes bacterium]|nr:VWA domain-containing protein [Bacillota bacterium]